MFSKALHRPLHQHCEQFAFHVMALLDIGGTAEFLNVNPRFIRRLVAERRINYLKIGSSSASTSANSSIGSSIIELTPAM